MESKSLSFRGVSQIVVRTSERCRNGTNYPSEIETSASLCIPLSIRAVSILDAKSLWSLGCTVFNIHTLRHVVSESFV